MPIYEYECDACGKRLEAWQKMRDAPLSDCPNCHSPSLRKLMSAVGVNVKGAHEKPEPVCGGGACPACSVD